MLGFKSDGLDTGDLVASITEWLFLTESTFAPRIFLSFNEFYLEWLLCCYYSNITVTKHLLYLQTETLITKQSCIS